MHVESVAKLRDLSSVLAAEPGKLDIKRRSPCILYLLSSYRQGYRNFKDISRMK